VAGNPVPIGQNHDSPHSGTSETSDPIPTYLARFLVLARHHASRNVTVRLRLPATTQAALDEIATTLEGDFFSHFSQLVPTKQQLSAHWGTVVALPAWAQDEPMCVFDLREIDGRVYVVDLPSRITYADLIRKADLDPDLRYAVYPFGAGRPMDATVDLVLIPYGVICFCRPDSLVPHAPSLSYVLSSLAHWNENDPIPTNVVWNQAQQVCLVHENGMQGFTLLPGRSEHRNLDVANALGLPYHWTTIQIAYPPIRDVVIDGRRCKGVASVTDQVPNIPVPPRRPGFNAFTIIVDCRPLLMGLDQWIVTDHDCSHTEMVEHYDLWAPPDHQVQIDGSPLEGDHLLVAPGQVLVVQYVPVTPPSAVPTENRSLGPDISEPEMSADEGGFDETSLPDGPYSGFGDSDARSRTPRRSPVAPGESFRLNPTCQQLYARPPPSSTVNSAAHGVALGFLCQLTTPAAAGLRMLLSTFLFGQCTTPVAACALGSETHHDFGPAGTNWFTVFGVLFLFCLLGGVSWSREVRLCTRCYTLARRNSDSKGVHYRQTKEIHAKEAKLLVEPQGSTAHESRHLAFLRAIVLQLGGRWLYDERPDFIGVEDELDDVDSTSASEEEALVQVQCQVLKIGYTPERVIAITRIPATLDEFAYAVQATRSPDTRRLYPALMPVTPQPMPGWAIYLAGPSWAHSFPGVCFDTTAIDGRLFSLPAPDYATKEELVALANCRDRRPDDVEVIIGADSLPLLRGQVTHLFPGSLIRFANAGTVAHALTDLGQLLLQSAPWQTVIVLPVFPPVDVYCVVSTGECRLCFADAHNPLQYRRAIARVAEVNEQCMRIQAAQPRPLDAAVAGYACRTILAVAVAPTTREVSQCSCLVDCRPIQQGWLAVTAYAGELDLTVLCAQFETGAPRGWTVVMHPSSDTGRIRVVPGQIFIVEYAPQERTTEAAPSLARANDNTGSVASSAAAEATQPSDASPTSETTDVLPAASASGRGPVQSELVPFLLFAQEYWPELIVPSLRFPLRLEEALTTVTQVRLPEAQMRRPRLIPVFPQPRTQQICVLALPHWNTAGVAVLIDRRVAPCRTFAVFLPVYFTKAEEQDYVYVEAGDLLVICDVEDDLVLALNWALCWIIEYGPAFHCPVCLQYDCIAAGDGAFSKATPAQLPSLEGYPALSHTTVALRQIAAMRVDLRHSHIRGHHGDLGNEMSDALAKQTRFAPDPYEERMLPSWPGQLVLHPMLDWAWMLARPVIDMPTLYAFEAEASRLQQTIPAARVGVNSRESKSMDADTYLYDSQYGCALWISRSIPYATCAGQRHYIELSHCTVAAYSPRHLLVHITAPHLKIAILVAHAPADSQDNGGVVRAFWGERAKELRRIPADSPLLILMDANGRLGNLESSTVGPQGAELENPAGTALHEFLLAHRLYLPSTFPEIHHGDSWTWQYVPGTEHRIDYVAASEQWRQVTQDTYVWYDIETLQKKCDHLPVVWSCEFARTIGQSHPTFRRSACRPNHLDPHLDCKAFQQGVEDLTPVPWQTDVDAHYLHFARGWISQGRTVMPKKAQRPQQTFLTPDTLERVRERKLLRQRLGEAEAEVAKRHYIVGFAALTHNRAGTELSTETTMQTYRWLRDADRVVAQCWIALRRSCLQVRSAVKQDRLQDGSLAATTQERSSRWRLHFAAQELGEEVSPKVYVQQLAAIDQDRLGLIFFDVKAAYYQVIRETLTDAEPDDRVLLMLFRKIGVPDTALPELFDHLIRLNHIADYGGSAHLVTMTRELFAGLERPRTLYPASWADDFVALTAAQSGPHLVAKVQAITACYLAKATAIGMQLTFASDKTAVILPPSVYHAVSDALILTDTPDAPKHIPIWDPVAVCSQRLPVVQAFRHLGGIVTSGASVAPEIHYRYSQSTWTLRPLRGPLFGNASIPLALRKYLLGALVGSKYTFGSATLELHVAGHWRLWARLYTSIWKALRPRTEVSSKLHSYEALHMASATTPPLALAKARAGLYLRLIKYGPATLLHLLWLQWEASPARSWLTQLKDDLRHVSLYQSGVSTVLATAAPVLTLSDAIVTDHTWWRRQINAAIRTCAKDLADWVSTRAKLGAQDPPAPHIPDTIQEFPCPFCDSSFPLRKHLGVHVARRHGLPAPARLYAPHPTCVTCLRYFHTVPRLQGHLKASKACLARACELLDPMSLVEVREAELEDKSRLKRMRHGEWQKYQTAPPALPSSGPPQPTRAELLAHLGDEAPISLLRRSNPDPKILAWVLAEVPKSSTEPQRTGTCSFWMHRVA
ncbi:unnamed protein product, partial [Symbiodinium sp. CCMP2456]